MTINYHNLNKILDVVKNYDLANLLIVTKNQNLNDIRELINKDFKIFGENRVQEAKSKYQEIIEKEKINLHLIGPLQTNKAKDALFLFDTIQSIDREKLVDEISKFIIKDKYIKTKSFYIQINIGAEVQKSGIEKSQCINFYEYALNKNLNIGENMFWLLPGDECIARTLFGFDTDKKMSHLFLVKVSTQSRNYFTFY